MKHRNKLLLLAATILPLLLIPILILWIIGGGIRMSQMANPEFVTPVFVSGIVIFGILISIISLGTWIYYLIHVIQNNQIENSEKIIWCLLFVFVGFISHIVYFFMRIWELPETDRNQYLVT